MSIPAHFLVLCVVCTHSKYVLFSIIYCSFCLVPSSALAHTPICPHLNPVLCICTHSRHFLHALPKHHVRGNFPGHRTQILILMTLNDPCLPYFCVPRVSCAPTHPSAPTHTHMHLYLPIRTLFFNVYSCNLIEKHCSNYIV